MMKRHLSIAAALTSMVCGSSASAAVIKYDFTSLFSKDQYFWPDGFIPRIDASVTIDEDRKSVTDIGLAIGDHTYGLDEIGWEFQPDNTVLVGGLLNGINQTSGATNDFFFTVSRRRDFVISFYYNRPFFNGRYTTIAADSAFLSRITSATAVVPEPTSWALMLTGFGLTGYALRRRKANLAAA